jgi:hypothetical protein
LVRIAEQVRHDFGTEWHALPRAHEAFSAAIVQRLAAYPPPPSGAAWSDLFGPNDPPETIGRMRELDDRRKHSYPQLEAAQKRKTGRLFRHLRAKKEGNND